MISKTYPYLSISRKYLIPYGKVLEISDILDHGTPDQVDRLFNAATPVDKPVLADIEAALQHFKGIQSGAIPFPPT